MAAFVNIAIAEACPAHLCSPLRTETENAKRSFGFFITTTAGKPISGKLPRHSLLQGNGAFCQKWEQKTPRIFKNLWRCCLEQYSILAQNGVDSYYEYTSLTIVDDYSGSFDIEHTISKINELALEGWRLKATITNEIGKNSSQFGVGGFSSGTNATIEQTTFILERKVAIQKK